MRSGRVRAATEEDSGQTPSPGATLREGRARIYRKYPQYPSDAALGESDSVIVEIRPTHVFTWGLD